LGFRVSVFGQKVTPELRQGGKRNRRKVEEGGGRWRKVEEGGGRWRKVEEGGGRWRKVESFRASFFLFPSLFLFPHLFFVGFGFRVEG
jgi:hypothetical protein